MSSLVQRLVFGQLEHCGFDVPDITASSAMDRAGARLGWTDGLSVRWGRSVLGLYDLGFRPRDGIPTFAQVEGAVAPIAARLDGRRGEGDVAELVIAPSVQDIGLIGTPRDPGLLQLFDRGQDAGKGTYVWRGCWGKFGDKAPVHDNGVTARFSVAVLLGDVIDPLDPSKPANAYDQPGLVYPNTVVASQRSAIAKEARQVEDGLEPAAARISTIVLANASRRALRRLLVAAGLEVELPTLDEGRTFTNLVHYPTLPFVNAQSGPKTSYIPNVCWHDGRMRLSGTPSGGRWGSIGVRRELRLAVETAT
jgi:hypothetical protein